MCRLILLTLRITKRRRVRVCEIEVVRQLRMLRGHRRDALHARHDALLLTILTNGQVLLLHVTTLGLQHEAGNLEVAESTTLHLQQQLVGQFLKLVVLLQLVLQVDNVLQALQEPDVDLREFLDTLDGITLFKGLSDGEDTQIGRISQLLIEVVELRVVVAHETVHALTNHTQALLYHLLERTSNRHDLTHRLHGRTDLTAYASKLREVPARNLTDHIIEARSHVG